MGRFAVIAAALGIVMGAASPALAQRLPFERSFEVTKGSTLDVSTIRGKIDVSVGEPGRIVVAGTVTVRVGWDVPANAADLARKIADAPPIEREGSTVRLRPPSAAADRRAVTVSYHVRVPPDTGVVAVSDSGATTVREVSAPVTVRTQSGAIELTRLGDSTGVTTGSGSVTVDGVAGALTVTTSSSAVTARALGGGLRARTSSGIVDAALTGTGDVDVQTASGAIRLQGARGAVAAVTKSGRVSIHGGPGGPWNVSTGSGGVDMQVDQAAPFTVDATSRSGSVKVVGATVQGSLSKRNVSGRVNGGGPPVRVNSRSGAVIITVAPPVSPP